MNFSTDKYQIGTVAVGMADVGITNTPLLTIKLDNLSKSGEDIWDTVTADGGDIRVTNFNGTIQFPIDVLTIDVVAKTGTIWISATGGVASGDSIRVYVNGTDTMLPNDDTYGQQAVYNYKWYTVYHLNGNTLDSVFHTNGTATNITYDMIDSPTTGSAIFDGATSLITGNTGTPNAAVIYAANFKISALPPVGSIGMLACQTEYDWKYGDGASRYRLLYATYITPDGHLRTWWNANNSYNPYTMVDLGEVDLNRWYRFQSTFHWYGYSQFYLDGVQIANEPTNFNMSYMGYSYQAFTIGRATKELADKIGKSTFNGKMSEVFWIKGSSGVKNPDVNIQTETNNMLNLDTFFTWSDIMNGTAIQDDSNILYWQNF